MSFGRKFMVTFVSKPHFAEGNSTLSTAVLQPLQNQQPANRNIFDPFAFVYLERKGSTNPASK